MSRRDAFSSEIPIALTNSVDAIITEIPQFSLILADVPVSQLGATG